MSELTAAGSTVFLMVESRECVRNIEEIAAVPGVDVLLVGSNDLSLELGVLGEWDHPTFMGTLRRVSVVAKKHEKIFGLAGLYDRPDLSRQIVQELGARYILGNLDTGLLAQAAQDNVRKLRQLRHYS